MNIREILDLHPLPEGYYYKVSHKPDTYGREKTVMIMQSRAKWLDKKVASFMWRKEYYDYDRTANRRDLHAFLNNTVGVLDMRPRRDKVIPMVADVHMPQDTEPRWFRQVDNPALMR